MLDDKSVKYKMHRCRINIPDNYCKFNQLIVNCVSLQLQKYFVGRNPHTCHEFFVGLGNLWGYMYNKEGMSWEGVSIALPGFCTIGIFMNYIFKLVMFCFIPHLQYKYLLKNYQYFFCVICNEGGAICKREKGQIYKGKPSRHSHNRHFHELYF